VPADVFPGAQAPVAWIPVAFGGAPAADLPGETDLHGPTPDLSPHAPAHRLFLACSQWAIHEPDTGV